AKKEKKPAEKKAPRQRKPKAITSLDQIKCPKCGKGHLLKGRSAYGCSMYASGCDMRLPFDSYAADLTPAQLADLLKKK
ncbi:MAG: DNA topoisomerase III, partial [Muribaculaceae bacterium]|nr:DNA topoisomerase III [Muribaculaceae bacterium]